MLLSLVAGLADIARFIFQQDLTNATGLTHKSEKTVAILGYNGKSARTNGVVVLMTTSQMYRIASLENQV